MNGQGVDNRIGSLVKELEDLCGSDELSVEALREKIDLIPSNAVQNPSFLHLACLNDNVTLEIIECISSAFPEAARSHILIDEFYSERQTTSTAYPLHLACKNEKCPSSVIKLLLQRSPPVALSHSWAGLSLHLYLSRPSNITLDTVKLLVEAYPRALTVSDGEYGEKCIPLHTLLRNPGIKSLYDILQFLIEAEPRSVRITSYHKTPLHVACTNKNIDPRTVRVLLEAWPESITQQDGEGCLPIHTLCFSSVEPDDEVLVEVLTLLVEASPASVQHADVDNCLPIYYAIIDKSLSFCKVLTDAFPESVRDGDETGSLPIHHACMSGNLDVAKYLLELYPEGIDIFTDDGVLPIHLSCDFGNLDVVKYLLELYPEGIDMFTDYGMLPIHEAARSNQAEMIKFLLLQDPVGASRATADTENVLPLHLACGPIDQEAGMNLETTKLLFDSYPEAIVADNRDGNTPLDFARNGIVHNPNNPNSAEVVIFLESQMVYARQAQNTMAVTTLDSNGQLPLHRALRNQASLGAIKLLVKANPSALMVADHRLSFPLHVACEYSTSDEIVQYLLEANDSCLDHCDLKKNSAFHYACRGGNCDVVKCLLDRHVGSHFVSERNTDNKLPMHLLFEAGEDRMDRESPEYVETIWRLIMADPETVLHFGW